MTGHDQDPMARTTKTLNETKTVGRQTQNEVQVKIEAVSNRVLYGDGLEEGSEPL